MPDVQATSASYEVNADGSLIMQINLSPREDYRYEVNTAEWSELSLEFAKDANVTCRLERDVLEDDLTGSCVETIEGETRKAVLFISMRQKGSVAGLDDDCRTVPATGTAADSTGKPIQQGATSGQEDSSPGKKPD